MSIAKPKTKRKMRIHQSICYCKLVHETSSLKFGDSLKLSFFFEAFPSVFARRLACSFNHSLQLGFRLACSCGGCGCVCVCFYMVNVENGNFFLCAVFVCVIFHSTSTWLKSAQITRIAFTCIWKWQMQTGITLCTLSVYNNISHTSSKTAMNVRETQRRKDIGTIWWVKISLWMHTPTIARNGNATIFIASNFVMA